MGAMTLLVGAAVGTVAAIVYLLGGRAVWAALQKGDRKAAYAFAAFWTGVGAVHLLQAALNVAAIAGHATLPLTLAVWNTRIAIVLGAFFGLVYYQLYIYTGRSWILWPLATYYVAAYVFVETWIAASTPSGVLLDPYRVRLAFATPVEGAVYHSVVLVMFVPPLVAALAYLGLLRVADDPARRYRVLLTSISLIAYFALLIIGYLNIDWAPWGLLELLLGIAAGALVVAAYRPPAAVARRLTASRQAAGPPPPLRSP